MGNNSSGGSNFINNSGTVAANIYGTWNAEADNSGGNNFINNSGMVNGNIEGTHGGTGGNNNIINSGTVNGGIFGGDGNDTLELVNTGRVGGTVSGFDQLRKTGEGTATVGGLNLPGLIHTSIQGYAGYYPAIIATTANLSGDLEPYGYFPTGTVVLIQTNGLTGGFTHIIDNSPTLDFTVTNAGNNIELTTTRRSYTSVLSGLEHNDRAVAQVLSDEAQDTDGDMALAISVLDFLSKSDMRGAINQLWPTTLSALNSVGCNNAFLLMESGMTHLNGMRSNVGPAADGFLTGQNRVFLASLDDTSGLGVSASSQSDLSGFNHMLVHERDRDEASEFTGYKYSTVGNVLGMDRGFGSDMIGGFDVGYFTSNIGFEDEGDSDGKVETISAGVYGTRMFNKWYMDASVFGGYNWYESERRIEFGVINRIAEADYNGWMIGGRMEAGYDYKPGGFMITPALAVDYAYLHTESYREKGADDLNLHVESTSTNFLTTTLGLNVSYPFESTGDVTIIPSIYAGWRHEFLGNDEDIEVYLAGVPDDTFFIDTAKPDRDSALIGLSVLLKGERASFIVRYQTRLSDELDTTSLMRNFNTRFKTNM